jgi:hypothetical protein
MNVLSAISPGLKVLFERVGKPEIVNRPDLFRSVGPGAVIACNHVGWADSLCCIPKTATLYVKRGTVQFNAIALGFDARRFPSN